MSGWVDFKEVKARVSIREVLDHYGITYTEHANGAKLTCPCPIHRGDSPRAFHVDLQKRCWRCFTGCRRGGNVLDLVMGIEDTSVRQAALLLQKWFPGASSDRPLGRHSTRRRRPPPRQGGESRPVQRTAPAVAPSLQPPSPTPGENPPLSLRLNLRREHPYLTERGIIPEAVEEFGLGYCPRGILAGRIALPVHNAHGETVAYVGRHPRDGDPKYKFPKGFRKGLELFNLHRASAHAGDRGLILVEGFFDVVRLWQLGIENAVALMGVELSTQQEELLLATTNRIVLMLDGDDAGRAATAALLSRLARRCFVRVVDLPDGVQPDTLEEVPAVIQPR